MSSCLGLYIETNLIKYAKVSTTQSDYKVETFGVNFYEDLNQGIEQVIQETNSQNVPISVNLSDEAYNYFSMFGMLSKSDMVKAIQTEFDFYCNDKNINTAAFETRFAIVDDLMDQNKLRVIHVAQNKASLDEKIQQFSKYSLKNIVPLPISIPTLVNPSETQNYMVVNIEEKTTITTVLKNNIYDIQMMDEGSEEFLNVINMSENSFAKSYEIAKNTTIYTSRSTDTQEEYTPYINDIMSTLVNVISKVKLQSENCIETIKKVYITGTAALINNIDLYFQEYLPNMECKILTPYFIDDVRDATIKDYVETNSAIALAVMGLEGGVQGMNFAKGKKIGSFSDLMKLEVGGKSKGGKKASVDLKFDLGEELDKVEKGLVRFAVSILLICITYVSLSLFLDYQIQDKNEKADSNLSNTMTQIEKATADTEIIEIKTNEYKALTQSIEDATNKQIDENNNRNSIPNLLNQIMAVIPQDVQVTKIENTIDRKVVIEAQSEKYEQLGFFIAEIKTDIILQNVISTSGVKDNGIVTVKIEGELP